MKKRVLTVILALCLVCGLLPMTATARVAGSVTIAGVELTAAGYYGVSALSTKEDTVPEDANGYVHWDPSATPLPTLTLHGVTINGGISCNGDIIIVLEDANTVTNDSERAIDGGSGSITIKGPGSLEATGKTDGIYAMYTVSITEGATVTVTGQNGCGILNAPYPPSGTDRVSIAPSATATITGATYGIKRDSASGTNPLINSANVTVTGGTAAFSETPELGSGIEAKTNTTAVFESKYSSASIPNVTVEYGEHGTATAFLSSAGAGTVIPLTVIPGVGYRLERWEVLSGDITVNNDNTFTMPDTDVSIKAFFEPIPSYSVTFSGGDDAEGTAPTQDNTMVGTKFTLPANTFTKDGCIFAGWFDGSRTYSAGAEYTMPENGVTFVAQWRIPAISHEIEDVTFGYAYDVRKELNGGKLTLNNFNKPLDENGTPYAEYTGSWTLHRMGTLSDAALDSGKLTEISRILRENYVEEHVDINALELYELKNGDTHVAYGAVIAYDSADGYAAFIGDSYDYGAGYLLSENEVTAESVEITLHTAISLSQTGTYDFGRVQDGDPSPMEKWVTVSNSGALYPSGLNVAITGTHADSFEVREEPFDRGEGSFTVQPKSGLEAGVYTATVTVSGTNVEDQSFDVKFTVGDVYTVTYDANGADAISNTVPVDSNSYVSNALVTVLERPNDLNRVGYSFDGWNTKADGSGTTYLAGQTFNITEDTTLYAKWAENPHEHNWTYTANGATITAECRGNGECDVENTEITIVKPTLERYDGSGDARATIAGNKTSVGGEDPLPNIQYQKKTGEGTYDTATTTPPTIPGTYKASITVVNAIAEVEYTIEKRSSSFYDNIDGDYTITDITHNSFKVTIKDVHGLRSQALEYAVENNIDSDNFTPVELDGNYCFTVTVDDELIGDYIEFALRVKAPDEYTEPGTMDTEMVQLSAEPTPTPAEAPAIGTDLSTTEVTYEKDAAAAALSITASVTDGGTLTYQWYKNDEANTTTPTLIDGATNASYIPATSASGTTYYYCVITNTKDGQTATATSAIAMITVNEPAPSTYTVTFNANGHGTAPDPITNVTSGNTITAPDAPVADGWIFGGWYKESGCENAWNFSTDTVTENTTLYAKWTQNEGKKDTDVDDTDAGDYKGTTVNGWGDLTVKDDEGNDYPDNVTVEVKLTITAKTENTALPAEVTAIKNAASGKTLQFLDLTLSRKVGSDPVEDIGDNNTQLLTIVIPFEKGSKQGITVYRYHGTRAEVLTENPAAGMEGFEVGEVSITIYAKKFSTYAIGYTVPAPTPTPVPPIYIPPVHDCTSKCEVCGGCEDAKCGYSACEEKCVLLGMNFTDVEADTWYTDAVEYVYHRGMMDGVGNNRFDVNGTTTRAMIVTILWRLEGEPVVNYLMPFEDIPAESWYTEAVRWAASEKIVEGWNGKFDPLGEITREQFATILLRYAKYKQYDVSSGEDFDILSYKDASSICEYAVPAMQWVCSTGLMEGYDMNLTPKADASRAQAAALFQRFCENVAEK